MTLEEAKELKSNQEVYYKSIYTLLPEKVIVQNISYDKDNMICINLQDGSYIPQKHLEQLFSDKNKCIESCKEDLNKRIEKLGEFEDESI